jgi:hypothetical protein
MPFEDLRKTAADLSTPMRATPYVGKKMPKAWLDGSRCSAEGR